MIGLFFRGVVGQFRQSSNKGFILPVVIILSLAISTVSITTLQSVSNSSSTLNDQYYKTLAREAAQAGLAAAGSCIKKDSLNLWADTAPLGPKTNCLGQLNTSGLDYVSTGENGRWESTYSVKAPQKSGSSMTITSVGTVKLKSVAGTTLQTITHSLKSIASTGGTGFKASTDISAGQAHVCTVADLRAYCWGWNQNGQLGDGSFVNRSSPVAVSENAVAIPAKPSVPNPCGGGGWPPQPACTSPAVPAQPASQMAGKNVSAVSAGNTHTCAIAEGNVYCWGNNSNGQLGDGTTTSSAVPVAVSMTPVDIPATPSVPNPCGGGGWPAQPACVTPAKPAVPKSQLYDKITTSITAGDRYTCALAYPKTGTINDSRAYCWGLNSDGQLGVNDKVNRLVPTAVYAAAATPAVAAQPALPAGCGSWNNPCTTPAKPAVAAQPNTVLWGKTITLITAGDEHTCAVTSEGAGYCWGQDTSGQVGSGQTPTTRGGTPPMVGCSNTDVGTRGSDPGDVPDIIAPKAIHVRDAYTFTDAFGNEKSVAASALFGRKIQWMSANGTYTNALADDGKIYWWGGKRPVKHGRTTYGYSHCWDNKDKKYVYERHSVKWDEYEFDIHDEPIGPVYQTDAKCWWLFKCKDTSILRDKQFKAVSGSSNIGTVCMLDLADIVYCDGAPSPYYGQRGDSTPLNYTWSLNGGYSNSNPSILTQSGALAGKTITKMDSGVAGLFHCVIANKAPYCWGINDVGEMGDGTIGVPASKIAPTPVDISGVLSKPGGGGGVIMSDPITF